ARRAGAGRGGRGGGGGWLLRRSPPRSQVDPPITADGAVGVQRLAAVRGEQGVAFAVDREVPEPAPVPLLEDVVGVVLVLVLQLVDEQDVAPDLVRDAALAQVEGAVMALDDVGVLLIGPLGRLLRVADGPLGLLDPLERPLGRLLRRGGGRA